MSAGIRRWTRQDPCQKCGGHPYLPRGEQVRCYGGLLPDGRAFICTRDEHAGDLPYSAGAKGYIHTYIGQCRCGETHGNGLAAPVPQPRKPAAPERGTLSPERLDLIFRRLAELLPLRPGHRATLYARGEPDAAAAERYGYWSLPFGYTEARRVVTRLCIEFGAETMALVPGFYRSRRADRLLMHTATAGDDWAVIPCRNATGLTTSSVRMPMEGKGAKYKTFQGGGAAFTIAGTFADHGPRLVLVTEGPHKANTASMMLPGVVIVGLSGTDLPDAALEEIRKLTPDVVIEALDADKFEKKSVVQAATALRKKLLVAGFMVEAAVWELADGKGIDDLLANGHTFRRRLVAHAPAVGARKPHPIAVPGALPQGRPLAEVQGELARAIHDFMSKPRKNLNKLGVFIAPPGLGKTHAAITEARRQKRTIRVFTATLELAHELAEKFPWLHVARGRTAENCRQFEAIQVARRKRADVNIVCKSCPFFNDCHTTEGMYFNQFQHSGSLVLPIEMLLSSEARKHGEVFIFDDAELLRLLIERHHLSAGDALSEAQRAEPGPIRDLLLVIKHAVDTEHKAAAGHFREPLVGADAWDALARLAGSGEALMQHVRDAQQALPRPAPFVPPVAAEAQIDYLEALPPAALSLAIEVMEQEADDFASGRPFNSGLTLSPAGLTVRQRRPLTDKDGKPLLAERVSILLDAAPLDVAIERLGAGLTVERYEAPPVALPANVRVTQHADRFHAKSTLDREACDEDGLWRPDRDQLITEIATTLAEHPADRAALIIPQALEAEALAAIGLPPERIAHYHGLRGLNRMESADLLIAAGRPSPPLSEMLSIAQTLHHDGEPIALHLIMQPVSYGGYRDAEGQGRAIEVLDFVDERVAAIQHSFREAELVQAVHRARPLLVAQQPGLFEGDGPGLAHEARQRQTVEIVILGAHPVPGLRIDVLEYDEAVHDRNAEKQAERRERTEAAITKVQETGLPITAAAVAREGSVSRRGLAKLIDKLITPDPTVIDLDLYYGVITPDQFSESVAQVPDQSADGSPGAPAPRTDLAQAVLVYSPEIADSTGPGEVLAGRSPRCQVCGGPTAPARRVCLRCQGDAWARHKRERSL